MSKWLRYIIFILIALMCSAFAEEEYYRNTVPGIPVAPGQRLGGLWERTEPQCGHDLSSLDTMKEEAAKSSANWRKVAFGTSILAFLATCVWYVLHVPQAGGVAIVSILYSAFSTFMAVAMTIVWLVVLLAGVVMVIGLGLILHKKCAWKWFKKKQDDKHIKELTNVR